MERARKAQGGLKIGHNAEKQLEVAGEENAAKE
jgi:hypothetical protein